MRTRSGFFVFLALAVALCGCTKKKTEEKSAKAQLTEVALPSSAALPEEVVLYLLFANPNKMLGDLEKLGGKVSPVPPGTLHAMGTGLLIQMGFKDTSVLNLNAPLGIMVLDPKRHPKPGLMALQVKGEDQVLKSMQPAWKHKGSAKGIHELAQEQVDTYKVFKGDSAKPPPKVSKSLFVRFSGKTMLLADSKEALEFGGPLLEKQMKTSAPAQGVVGAVLVNHLRKIFQAELQAAPEQFVRSIKPELIQSGLQDADKMAWMMDWIFQKTLALVQQTREITFSAAFSQEGAMATFGIVPEAGSFFRKFLAEQKHAPLQLVKFLPQDQFLAVAFNIQWRAFRDDLVEFTREIMKIFTEKDLSEEFLAAIIEMWDVMGDEIALSENLDADGLSIAEIFTVKDEEKARQAIGKVMQMSAKLLADGKGLMGMKFSGPEDIGSHDQVKMQAMYMEWDLSSMPAQQSEMLKRFYGDKLTMVMAIFNGKFGLTMGKKAKEDMQALIDRVRKNQVGLTGSKAFQHASGDLMKDCGGFFYMSIAQLVVTSLEGTYAAMGQKPPDIKLPSPGSGMFMSFKSTPDRVNMTMRIPSQHLSEIGLVVKALMSGQGQ